MIGSSGQYLFSFSIGSRQDFLAEEDLGVFILEEMSGNRLPAFAMEFFTSDESVIFLLNEGNDINVSFGVTTEKMTDSKLTPMELNTYVASDKRIRVVVQGLYAAEDYITNSNIQITSKKSGIAALKDVISPHFTPDFNIESSLDSQNWIQSNITDKRFVNDLWLRSDLGNSFPAICITTDGKFRLRDIKKMVGQPVDWTFTRNINNVNQNAKTLSYADDYEMSVNSNLINQWTGYGRFKQVYNIEEDQENTLIGEPEIIMAITNKLAKSSRAKMKFSASGFVNDNVHANYEQSYMSNLAKLAEFGNFRVSLSFEGILAPIRVLDLAFFKDTALDDNTAMEYSSGKYIVSKVTRNLTSKTIATVVELCRESMNQVTTVA